jgi:hypothetical protein
MANWPSSLLDEIAAVDAEHPSHLLLPITRGNIVGMYLSGGDRSIREPKLD